MEISSANHREARWYVSGRVGQAPFQVSVSKADVNSALLKAVPPSGTDEVEGLLRSDPSFQKAVTARLSDPSARSSRYPSLRQETT